MNSKLALLVLAFLTSCQQVTAQETAPIRDSINTTSAVPKTATVTVVPKHYIGFGLKRSVELLKFPVVHPIQFANNCTFPVRHPLVATYKFGKAIEPYQPALNAAGALGAGATPFLVKFRGH